MLNREQVQIFSKELKIDTFSVYREYLQLLFLKYFYDLKESNQVYFKGGTAIKFLPLNQRTTVAKIKIWLIEKLGERE